MSEWVNICEDCWDLLRPDEPPTRTATPPTPHTTNQCLICEARNDDGIWIDRWVATIES